MLQPAVISYKPYLRDPGALPPKSRVVQKRRTGTKARGRGQELQSPDPPLPPRPQDPLSDPLPAFAAFRFFFSRFFVSFIIHPKLGQVQLLGTVASASLVAVIVRIMARLGMDWDLRRDRGKRLL